MTRKNLTTLLFTLTLGLVASTSVLATPVNGGPGGGQFVQSFFDVFIADDSLMTQVIHGLQADASRARGEDRRVLINLSAMNEEIISFILFAVQEGEGYADLPMESLSLNFHSEDQFEAAQDEYGDTLSEDEFRDFCTEMLSLSYSSAKEHHASQGTLTKLQQVRNFYAYGTLKY